MIFFLVIQEEIAVFGSMEVHWPFFRFFFEELLHGENGPSSLFAFLELKDIDSLNQTNCSIISYFVVKMLL